MAAVSGLLAREPDFGRQLRLASDKFLTPPRLSTLDGNDKGGENPPDSRTKSPEADSGSSRRPPGRATSDRKGRQRSPPQMTPPAQTWGGYIVSHEASPTPEPQDLQLGFPTPNLDTGFGPADFQVITRATEDNACFPHDWNDSQQFRVELPQISDLAQSIFPEFLQDLPLPKSYSFKEISFARRIQRAALERGFKLVTMRDPPPKRFQDVFGLTLHYNSKEQIAARAKQSISKDSEPLSDWHAPFVHIGGAGTYYPASSTDISSTQMPKFCTGLSQGPWSPAIVKTDDELMRDDLRCILPGFEGEFFDSNDVEGYLQGRGIVIPPLADFVTAELDLSALAEPLSPGSSGLDSVATILAPTGSADAMPAVFDPEVMSLDTDDNSKPWNVTGLDREGYFDHKSSLDPFAVAPGHVVQDPSMTFVQTKTSARRRETTVITINIETLMDGEIFPLSLI